MEPRLSAKTFPGKATPEQIRIAFIEYEQGLTWLAEYLTGDEKMAAACVIDARERTELEYALGQEWFCTWPRDATILSSLECQRTRIGQLARVHEGHGCVHGRNGHLRPETIEFVAGRTGLVRFEFDALCRFVFVLCCLERKSADEAALFLGISRKAVEGAYCVVFESLEAMCCELLSTCNNGVLN